MKIKTGYYDWKETTQAKRFVQAMQRKKMKVYMLEESGDAYPLIAARNRPTPQQISGLKSGGYEDTGKPHRFSPQQAQRSLTEVKPEDFDNNHRQIKQGRGQIRPWWK